MSEGRTCRCYPGCSVTVLDRDSARAVGSVQGQLPVSGTNPGNFIRSQIRPLLDQERVLDLYIRT